jgi:polyhydroxyalkanoate synthesis regulator phasin
MMRVGYWLSVGLLAGALYADVPSPDPKAQARHALATRTVAQEARSVLATWAEPDAEPEPWVDALTRAMLDEPGQHANRDKSNKNARAWLEKQRADQFMDRMRDAVWRANEQSPVPVTLEDALKQADPQWDKKRKEASAAFAQALLPDVYDAARTQAIERQRAQLVANQTYPPFEELDKQLIALDPVRGNKAAPLDASAFQPLDDWLRGIAVPETGPVFDEVRVWLGEMASAMRMEIVQQYRAQLRAIEPMWRDGLFPADMYTREQFEQAMMDKLQTFSSGNPDAQPPVYPLFSIVKQWVADAAAQWEGKKLADYLEDDGSVWRPGFEQANALLEESVSDDLRELADTWAQRVQSGMADAYVRAHEQWDQSEARAYVRDMMQRNSAAAEAVRAYVSSPLRQALDSWNEQKEIVRALEKEWMENLREDVANQVRVEQVLRKWTSEWERRWQDRARDMDEEWRGMFDRTKDELNKTVRQWYESVETAQTAATAAQASAAGEDDPESEAPTSEKMTPIDRPEETPGNQQEPMPETEGAGQGVETEAGMSESLRAYQGRADGVFSFTDLPDGRCRLLFGAPDGTGAQTIEFDPADVETAARQIADVLRGPLRDVLNGAATTGGERRSFFIFSRSRPSELRLLFRVGSPAIRHQMSILIRRHLDDEIAQWAEETGQPAPTLFWQEEAQ